MDYRVEAAMDPELLERAIRNLLANGWQLQGGISIAWNGMNPPMYAQALIRSLYPETT